MEAWQPGRRAKVTEGSAGVEDIEDGVRSLGGILQPARMLGFTQMRRRS